MLEESCDVRDTAQLLVFLQGIRQDFKIMEELAALRSIKGKTTGSDLFKEVDACMVKLGLKWDKLVGVTTDGCPNLTGKNVRLLKQIQDKVTELGSEHKLVLIHCIIHQHVLCRSVLKLNHVINVVTKTINFIRARALNHRQFVALLEEHENEHGDIRQHTAVRWLSLGKVLKRFWDLKTEIQEFCKNIEDEMHLVSSPFTCRVDNAPIDVQLELIDLQSDTVLAEHFKSASLLEFYSSLKEENFPNMRRHAQKMLVLFGSTYICEQTFSVIKFTKSRFRSSVTDDHLSAVLRISTSDIQPDFDALVKAQQRLDFSH